MDRQIAEELEEALQAIATMVDVDVEEIRSRMYWHPCRNLGGNPRNPPKTANLR